LSTLAGSAAAHGFAGKRFFPATLAIEDPFVADELSLPTISSFRQPASGDEPASRETAFAIDMSKRITEDFGIGFGASWLTVSPSGGESQHGFDNLALSAKYKFFQDDAHETILSAGVDWDIGGSGTRRVGAESFSTVTPSLFFGKGFGDLPEEARWLRPFAVTGQLGVGIPSRASTTTVGDDGDDVVERHPHVLQWGFALEYSIPYLQSFVKDVGLTAPFDRMIGVIEVPLSTPLDRGGGGTTGTINPGLIWAGRFAQVSAEAQIPINSRTGSHVGFIVQLHFYLDDLFPSSIGRPLIRS
jgi:hypothetical protein